MGKAKTFIEEYFTVMIAAFALFMAGIAAYFFTNKFGFGYWDTVDKWGQTGDFFGGILNPIFTFCGFGFLIYTISQNKKIILISKQQLELAETELELTRKEVEDSKKALQEQSLTLKQQRFESSFFNLLQQFTNQINFINNSGGTSNIEYFYSSIIVDSSSLEVSKEILSTFPNVRPYCEILKHLLLMIKINADENVLNANAAGIVKSLLTYQSSLVFAVYLFEQDESNQQKSSLNISLIKDYNILDNIPINPESFRFSPAVLDGLSEYYGVAMCE